MISSTPSRTKLTFSVSRHRSKIWLLSLLAVVLSITGLVTSWLNPSISFPLRPGLDFTGGTQIKLERKCDFQCGYLETLEIADLLKQVSLNSVAEKAPPNLNAK